MVLSIIDKILNVSLKVSNSRIDQLNDVRVQILNQLSKTNKTVEQYLQDIA
jgi:hypothetical protein